MKNKFVVAFVLLSVVLFALSGCQKAPEVKLTQVNIGTLKGPSGVSLLKMMDTEQLLGADISVNYSIEAQPDVLTAKLLAGEIDLATIPTNTASILYNKGADYRIVAMNTWGVLYIVGTDESIKSLEDLKGKSMHSIGKGTTPDIVLQYLMKQAGVESEKDVMIDYSLPHQELATALIAGKADLAMLPEPFVTMALMQNPNLKVRIDIQKEWTALNPSGGALPQTCLVAKGSLIDEHPEVLEALLKAYGESIDYANTSPVETGALAEKLELFPKGKIIEMAIPRLMLDNTSMKESKPLIEAYFNTLMTVSPEAIGGKLPDEKLYHIQ